MVSQFWKEGYLVRILDNNDKFNLETSLLEGLEIEIPDIITDKEGYAEQIKDSIFIKDNKLIKE